MFSINQTLIWETAAEYLGTFISENPNIENSKNAHIQIYGWWHVIIEVPYVPTNVVRLQRQ